MRRIPDGAVVLLDGLIASAAPAALVPEARRLRQVVLMHMPLGDRREREVLEAAAAIVTTSEWSRRRLGELYGLPPSGCTWPSRASTPPIRRRGARPATGCSASRP